MKARFRKKRLYRMMRERIVRYFGGEVLAVEAVGLEWPACERREP